MNFPIVIHKDKASDYGVTVPDLPGCFSAGRTLDEALVMAREAIELHLEALVDQGLAIPLPAPLEHHQHNPDFAGGAWAVVTVDESSLRLRSKRINISMPERVLDAVDRYARTHGETRSGLLSRAATAFLGRNSDSRPAPAERRTHSQVKPKARAARRQRES